MIRGPIFSARALLSRTFNLYNYRTRQAALKYTAVVLAYRTSAYTHYLSLLPLSSYPPVVMMLSTISLIVAIVPAILACENPDTHPCASAFVSNTALATSFCATYTKSVVTATTAIPSIFNSACSSKSQTISEACTCFVSAAATTHATTVAVSLFVASYTWSTGLIVLVEC